MDDTPLRESIELYLAQASNDFSEDASFAEAMRYSLMAGGKRLRPLMLLRSCEMCGGSVEEAMPFAVAIEMIHTYSLIHDDLPALDNDSTRRGRPTSHIVFGEAQAILSGDGLLNAAAEVLLASCLNRQDKGEVKELRAAYCILEAAGAKGMLLGQWLDMRPATETFDREQLEKMHQKKTGALFSAALEAGAILAGANERIIDRLRQYARFFGMVFQMTDDILDVTGDPAKLGKSIGKDIQEAKETYVTVFGLEKTQEMAKEYAHKAAEALEDVDSKQRIWFTDLVFGLLNRNN